MVRARGRVSNLVRRQVISLESCARERDYLTEYTRVVDREGAARRHEARGLLDSSSRASLRPRARDQQPSCRVSPMLRTRDRIYP
jgi:hypothetical protein